MFKSSIRQRKYDYLIRQGFFHREALELSRVSRRGMSAPYFTRMIRSRRRTIDNLKSSGKSDKDIREYIRQQYINNGWLKQDKAGRVMVDPWKLLRSQEDKARRRGEEYESPWRKRVYKKSAKKKETKRITRKDMLKSMIEKLERRIQRTGNINKRLVLEEKLYDYQYRLRRMEG